MRIAIVGAGLCGLAVTWYLFQSLPTVHVTLFDGNGIGGGASGIAAGLLHPFAGAHAKLNRYGYEGMATTLKLIDVAATTLKQPIILQQGILRPALTSQQYTDFELTLKKNPHLKWLTSTECQSLEDRLVAVPSLWIPEGIAIDCPLYLKGLWQACQNKGAQFVATHIDHLDAISDYDIKILTNGAWVSHLVEQIPVQSIKGQVLIVESLSLPCAINSQVYILTHEAHCLLGATFERDTLDSQPDIKKAQDELIPKLKMMLPGLKNVSIQDCRASLRATTSDHLPLLKQVDSSTWILTGMGSKGLLYHALFANQLVKKIIHKEI